MSSGIHNSELKWRFWIDVGGTFTDCVALGPRGQHSCRKTLSSGVVKGDISRWLDDRTFCDETAPRDTDGFWVGYECRLIDAQGSVALESRVESYQDGVFTLKSASRASGADDAGGQNAASQATRYELSHGDEAPILAIRRVLQLPLASELPPVDVRLGTTRGTNALLTRNGAKTALLITSGFRDLPLIGNQDRPRLFELNIVKAAPLHSASREVDERIDSNGRILRPLDANAVRAELEQLSREGFESLAICFLNAYRNPAHELEAAEIARQVGFLHVTRSQAVSPLVKLVARTDTAIVDAYLNPTLRHYVDRIAESLGAGEQQDAGKSQLRLLASSGGLVSGAAFTGKDSILSGPAGGVVGSSRSAQAAGFARAIGFDMGGTSTDVSRFSGRLERRGETTKAGVRIVAPMLAIETIAAGGGSICVFDGVRLTVGPASTGAEPGPACYGRGGPLAVTDMNLWLGRLPQQQFPFALDRQLVGQKLETLCQTIRDTAGTSYTTEKLAEGFLRVANANMARAIRSISLAEGYDPRDHVLAAFGGAAPQHACAVADELGMTQILVHPLAGVLSAWGAGMANIVQHAERAVYALLEDCNEGERKRVFEELEEQAVRAAIHEGAVRDRVECTRWVDVRYLGVDAALSLVAGQESLLAQFGREHRRRYGYAEESRSLEIVALRVEAIGRSDQSSPESKRVERLIDAKPSGEIKAFFDRKPVAARLFERASLKPGNRIRGPAIVTDSVCTIVVEPAWEARVLSEGELLIERDQDVQRFTGTPSTELSCADPTQLEVFNNRFASIAEQMGIALRNTSASVNVKERLDFSCALFTADGGLVVNAPHIPVHLGAMAETVRCVLDDHPDLAPGDVVITNDPYRGGSHLPDVTVITPVFRQTPRGSDQILFLTASRAHHAEIGGSMPGSMPPLSTRLVEEGVLLESFKVVAAGKPQLDELLRRLSNSRFPSRSPEQNIADVNAQIAANKQGAEALQSLMDEYGVSVVRTYMRHIRSAAAKKTRLAIGRMADGVRKFSDHLDSGEKIQVTMTIQDQTMDLNFQGTDKVSPSNLNANRAIVSAAVMYCLRCVLDEDIPLNQGVLDPVTIHIPPDSLLHPQRGSSPECSPAVAGGNVETSQRIVDVLLGAFGSAAASQGTMNNVLFGDETFGYYETISGGAGATLDSGGASAVHTHMTNTRITDPEVLEQRLPAMLLEFSIREGSGGDGKHRGGDGVVRRIRFLKDLQLSILSQRRGPYPPYGIEGGQPGKLGANGLLRANGKHESLPAIADISVQAGDELIIETPGGGGAGRATR